jgi:2-C-methyl-D-erythritol 4-phosphate cytidylyltransferase
MSGERRAVAIVLAAGAGRRLGSEIPKAFLTIGDRPMLSVAVGAAAASPAIDAVIVTAPIGYEEAAAICLEGLEVPCTVVTGGPTRQASVRLALGALGDDVDVVAVHDAARPFAPPDLFTAVVDAVHGGVEGAVPVLPIMDTVKHVDVDLIVGTMDRSELALAQTPQAFPVATLRAAHERAAAEGVEVTDDAMLLEASGKVVTVPGDPGNVKITTMLDLAQAEARMGGVGG